MTWAILITNIKGGVGKSTIAQKLSERLIDEGYNIGVLDADVDSANLATRLGLQDERVEFEGDHVVQPVQKNGMKVYSMENAFDDAAFSQNGQFLREVIANMVEESQWGNLDYMIVDCPPGSSDIFEELVRALRKNLLGAFSVGISDAVDDTERLVKVCNHNWVPILGFVENMSGVYCHGSPVTCDNNGSFDRHTIYPFGKGNIEQFANAVEGEFAGRIPLCIDETPIDEAAPETFDRMVELLEGAEEPKLPDDNVGNKNFIKNVWGMLRDARKLMNRRMDIEGIRDQYGAEGRDPMGVKIELSDATALPNILSGVVLTAGSGKIEVMTEREAKRRGLPVEGTIRINSQDMHDALRGEKEVMNSVTGDIEKTPYSIVEAVKMGDADIWGNRTINRLAVLDRILSDVISMDDIRDIVGGD